MPATMFTMGFGRSNFQPLPLTLGISFRDIQDQWKKYYEQAKDVRDALRTGAGGTSTPIPAPTPVPAPESKILGLPASTALIGGAVLLGGGILAAVLLSGN